MPRSSGLFQASWVLQAPAPWDAEELERFCRWSALHCITGPAISEISSTNEFKKASRSVHAERLALCPAHMGTRSDRPAASAAIERFLTSARCSGYGKISTP